MSLFPVVPRDSSRASIDPVCAAWQMSMNDLP